MHINCLMILAMYNAINKIVIYLIILNALGSTCSLKNTTGSIYSYIKNIVR